MGTVDPEFFSWYDVSQALIFFGHTYLQVLVIIVVTRLVFGDKK